MNPDVFERYEIKYLIDRRRRDAVCALIAPRMDRDAFGEHTVMSLYYDTPDFRIIRRSIEKPVFKEKLRLRSYGVPKRDDGVYIELKSKFRGVVYKRRTAMRLSEAKSFLAGNAAPRCQIEREAAAFLARYPGIRPAALICCEREAYFGREEEARLRVTFDEDIRCRADRLDPALGSSGARLMERGEYLMEVKLPGVMPLWLAHGLDALGVYPASFSKYGAAFEDGRHIAYADMRNGDFPLCLISWAVFLQALRGVPSRCSSSSPAPPSPCFWARSRPWCSSATRPIRRALHSRSPFCPSPCRW